MNGRDLVVVLVAGLGWLLFGPHRGRSAQLRDGVERPTRAATPQSAAAAAAAVFAAWPPRGH